MDDHLDILTKNRLKSEKTFAQLFPNTYEDIIAKTSFLLPQDCTWNLRKYCYINNIKDYPRCVVCGATCKLKRKTCSKTCTDIYNKSSVCISKKLIKTKALHGDNCFKNKKGKLENLKKTNPDLYQEIKYATSWMPENTSFSELIYCYKHKLKEYPKCVICGATTKFIQGYGYTKTCSQDCLNKYNSQLKKNFSEEKKAAIKLKTFKTVSNFSKEKKALIKLKKEQTCLSRYQAKAPALNKTIETKIKQTCLAKYGVDNIFKDKAYIKEKTKFKLGIDNIFKNSDYIKSKQIEKYGSITAQKHLSQDTLNIFADKDTFVKFI